MPTVSDNPTVIPARRDDLVCHLIDDEALLYDPRANVTHRLNATARYLWERLDGSHSCRDLARMMTGTYDVDENRAFVDTEHTIREMERNGLVRSTTGTET